VRAVAYVITTEAGDEKNFILLFQHLYPAFCTEINSTKIFMQIECQRGSDATLF
jgi:hypothetical protein